MSARLAARSVNLQIAVIEGGYGYADKKPNVNESSVPRMRTIERIAIDAATFVDELLVLLLDDVGLSIVTRRTQ
jgi:hypothetical protein